MTNELPQLNNTEKERYSRHLILPEVGMDGQRRLKNGRVLVVGAGGLGSPSLMYLAAAGVGTIGIIDFDTVDLSNLQRQIVHSTEEVGKKKTESARKRLTGLNPDVTTILHDERLSVDNALSIIGQYDVVVDGTDNFTTRYLVNDASILAGKPNVYGSIFRFEGQASVFGSPDGPCYRCLFPQPPEADAVPNCAEGGVLGVLAGVIGVIQATEALKLILKLGDSLSGRLLLYDAIEMRFDTLKLNKNKDCPICGDNPAIKELSEEAISCRMNDPADRSSLSAANTSTIEVSEVTVEQLLEVLKKAPPRDFLLLDVRNKEEYELCRIENSRLIPLPELPNRLNEIDRESDIVVYCKSGNRSRKASELLLSKGFTRVRNLKGGILQWGKSIDPSMVTY